MLEVLQLGSSVAQDPACDTVHSQVSQLKHPAVMAWNDTVKRQLIQISFKTHCCRSSDIYSVYLKIIPRPRMGSEFRPHGLLTQRP